MTPDEIELAKRRLAIETKLRRREHILALKQFEHESRSHRPEGWKILLTPTGGVLVAASLGLLGTAAGKWADYSVAKKQQETDIILKASEVPNTLDPTAQAIQRNLNILWFAERGYLPLSKIDTDKLRISAGLTSSENIPTPVIQTTAPSVQTTQLESQILNQKDLIKNLDEIAEKDLLARIDEVIPASETASTAAQKESTDASDPINSKIDELVGFLFSNSGNQRVKGYEALTAEPIYRTSTYAVNRIIKRGREKIGQPDGFIGLYHTIVTLTGMSRAVTKDTDLRDQIIDYANAVKDDQPRLKNRVDTLLKWLGAE